MPSPVGAGRSSGKTGIRGRRPGGILKAGDCRFLNKIFIGQEKHRAPDSQQIQNSAASQKDCWDGTAR